MELRSSIMDKCESSEVRLSEFEKQAHLFSFKALVTNPDYISMSLPVKWDYSYNISLIKLLQRLMIKLKGITLSACLIISVLYILFTINFTTTGPIG